MSPYELSIEALVDLQEIWSYIARDNLRAADKLEEDIHSACNALCANPGLGHKRTDLTPDPVLFWRVRGHYLVVYQRKTEPLIILRILHGARDASSEL